MKFKKSFLFKSVMLLSVMTLFVILGYGRFGGAGGHSSGGSHSSGSSSHSSSHSSSGHSSSYSSGHSSGSGGGISLFGFIFVIIIIVIILKVFLKKNDLKKLMDDYAARNGIDVNYGSSRFNNKTFPEGLNPEKISAAFMQLQNAWSNQDLSQIRKWISDGMYQRLFVQILMMQKLTQRNITKNIRIHDISVAYLRDDFEYQVADIAISFSLDDAFISEKYPDLNESFYGDKATEIWTFIKSKHAHVSENEQVDLINTNNCPNCGASLDHDLGEVSRCPSCKTLVNNATYDWVLNEVTQEDVYDAGNELLDDPTFKSLVQGDKLFSIQRMEDIASNVFMQLMAVYCSGDKNKLNRFADQKLADQILQQHKNMGDFVFDRLYCNDVTLQDYTTDETLIHLRFYIMATYQRVKVGTKLQPLDNDIDMHGFTMVLSKTLKSLQAPEKDIAFSYECPSCGAPYDDTTEDSCNYCGEPLLDLGKNWVLTDFSGEKD